MGLLGHVCCSLERMVILVLIFCFLSFFFQAEDGIRDLVRSRGLEDVYERQSPGQRPGGRAGPRQSLPGSAREDFRDSGRPHSRLYTHLTLPTTDSV